MQDAPILLATLEYPPQHGGIATYLQALVRAIPDGRAVVLAPRAQHAHGADMQERFPIFRRRLLSGFIRPRWIPALFWTAWAVRNEKPSMLVVSHLLPMGTVARWMRYRHGTPYAVILHGMDIALALHAGGRKLAEAKRVLSGASVVAVNSAFTGRLAESAGVPREKIEIVHPAPTIAPGVVISAGEISATREQNGLGNGFVVFSVGRLVERKGFDTLIMAIASLRRRGRDITLAIAGDGPDRARLEEIAMRENVLAHVRFLGAVEHAELPALHAAADVFCMPPRSIGPDVEGFGIVYLDAALMGKPSVATRTGGVPEAVVDGETGILVPPSDVPALAGALESLMDDPGKVARLGMQARQRAERDFAPAIRMRPLLERLIRR